MAPILAPWGIFQNRDASANFSRVARWHFLGCAGLGIDEDLEMVGHTGDMIEPVGLVERNFWFVGESIAAVLAALKFNLQSGISKSGR